MALPYSAALVPLSRGNKRGLPLLTPSFNRSSPVIEGFFTTPLCPPFKGGLGAVQLHNASLSREVARSAGGLRAGTIDLTTPCAPPSKGGLSAVRCKLCRATP